MVNNIISEWMNMEASWLAAKTHRRPAEERRLEKCRDYAAKLDRLVEAAREARLVLEQQPGTATLISVLAELTATLRDIELESER